MSGEPKLRGGDEHDPDRPPRRRLVVAGIGLLCLLVLAGGLFAFLRSDGSGTAVESVPEVTFGPEGDATTIAEPPPGSLPVLQVSPDAGPAGSEVTLQGASFKFGKNFRPVELTWDRPDGPRLKLVDGPRFSVQLQTPADAAVAKEGHNIVATQRTKDGKVVTQTAVRFFVVPGGR